MDRFEWTSGTLRDGEIFVRQQNGVRIYDGPEKLRKTLDLESGRILDNTPDGVKHAESGVRMYGKQTAFEYGLAMLTTFRILWRDSKQQGSLIALPLSQIIYVEELSEGISKSPKLALHLHPPHQGKGVGPSLSSSHSYIRLSFKEGGYVEFNRCLAEELSRKRWIAATPSKAVRGPQARKIHTGIVGIERKLEQQRKETDQNISKAFEDLNKLMDKAKDMVELSKSIARKIKDKQGDITEDETVKFKSYLLSLGIANPVTRETHGSGSKYHEELAKQLATFLQGPIEENGGMMALTDAFCRVNRARGIELLSPDDLINACRLFEKLNLPLCLRGFGSGVIVIESRSSEQSIVDEIAALLKEHESITADELSQISGVSVMLAKGRLLAAEDCGRACRDESVEGLRFYPNKFLDLEAS